MSKKTTFLSYLLFYILFSIVLNSYGQNKKFNGYILQDENQLAMLKSQYKEGDAKLATEIDLLLAEANKDLYEGPYSVTLQKTRLAPSGDAHDYISQAPYWWADPAKPDGKPYIRKDGQRNPEIYQIHDDAQMVKMSEVVKILAMAYYFTGKESYAEKAIKLLSVFFIEPATRMNPNLNYAQYIPGINDGRGIGIIESRGLVNIPDALAMMQQSKSLTNEFNGGIYKWFNEYLAWLLTSKNGTDESKERNNHGTNYDVQVVDLSIFAGNEKQAKELLEKETMPRLDIQFTASGEQPLELARTRSWDYTVMNMAAWCRLGVLANRVGVDLWHYKTADGKSIEKCVAWFQPYLLKQKVWDHQQIAPIHYDEILYMYHLATNGNYNTVDFEKVFGLYPDKKIWM